MPRMSKKRKYELSFYLNDRGRVTYNELCRKCQLILYGSRAKGTARERSDIDIAVSGVECFDELVEKIEELPTLYSVDLLNMDTCRNELLLEDIKQYGRKI